MKSLPPKLLNRLEKRKAEFAYRELLKSSGTDFYSNDYIGASKILHATNLAAGSTGSRLISGNSGLTETIEKELAVFFSCEAGLIFNSGYDANMGVLSSVPQRGDTILYDSLCHASIRDGIRLSHAKAFSFDHNNIQSLKNKFQRAEGDVYVIVESIYSMDGDIAPLQELADFCKSNGTFLIVDEAHAGGIYGPKGAGLVSGFDLNDTIFAKVITYGKAYGSHGAIVLGSEELRNYLINYARSFIYTTALSPTAQDRMRTITLQVGAMDQVRKQLFDNVHYFRTLAEENGIKLMPGDSPIQSIVLGGDKETEEKANRIRKKGVMVKAVLSPTVPPGTERIRISMHSYNTEDEIEELIKLLK